MPQSTPDQTVYHRYAIGRHHFMAFLSDVLNPPRAKTGVLSVWHVGPN